jgi:hypothetical protein
LLRAQLPPSARFIGIAPSLSRLIYITPLPEPIPLDPPRFDNEFNPAYFGELWLFEDGQSTLLGLVDHCFGLLWDPLWSANDNRAVVSTFGTPDIEPACMHDVWLVDLEARTVGTLPVPPEIDGFEAVDISADGNWVVLRHDWTCQILDLAAGQVTPFTERNPGQCILLWTEREPSLLTISAADRGQPRDTVLWHAAPLTAAPHVLATVPGEIYQWSLSPDQRNLALLVRGDNPTFGIVYSGAKPGLWLLRLPDRGG